MSGPDLPAIVLPAGGIVRGVGVDLIECARIQRVLERQGDRFLQRVFTHGELDYCMALKNPVPHLAARFAAKEAVSKCFTTGIGEHLGWKSIEVVKGTREQPIILLDPQGREFMHRLGCSDVLISLAHTATYGMAYALLLQGA